MVIEERFSVAPPCQSVVTDIEEKRLRYYIYPEEFLNFARNYCKIKSRSINNFINVNFYLYFLIDFYKLN